MDAWQSAVNGASGVLSAAAFVGLCVRRRARQARLFAVYLAAVAGYGLSVAFIPTLLSWPAWLAKETVLSVLTLAVGVEVGVHVYARAAGAARRLRAALVVLVLAVTGGFLLLDLPVSPLPAVTRSSPTEVAAFEAALLLLPRLAYASAWLFAALFAVATLGYLPLGALHRVILVGFGAYLCLYAVLLGDLRPDDRQARLVSDVLTGVYFVMLAVWTWVAWRPEREPAVPRPAPGQPLR